MLLKAQTAKAKKYRRHHGKSGAKSAAGKCNVAIVTHKTREIATRFSVAPFYVYVCVRVYVRLCVFLFRLLASRDLLFAISTTYINTPAGVMHNGGRVNKSRICLGRKRKIQTRVMSTPDQALRIFSRNRPAVRVSSAFVSSRKGKQVSTKRIIFRCVGIRTSHLLFEIHEFRSLLRGVCTCAHVCACVRTRDMAARKRFRSLFRIRTLRRSEASRTRTSVVSVGVGSPRVCLLCGVIKGKIRGDPARSRSRERRR